MNNSIHQITQISHPLYLFGPPSLITCLLSNSKINYSTLSNIHTYLSFWSPHFMATCSTVFLFLSIALKLSLIHITGICPTRLLKIERHWKMFWYSWRRISFSSSEKTIQTHSWYLPLWNFHQYMDILVLTNLRVLLALHSQSLSMCLPFTSISPSSSQSANLELISSPCHLLDINILPGVIALSIQSGLDFSWIPLSPISIRSELVWLLMLQGVSGSIFPSIWCRCLFGCGFIGAKFLTTLHHCSPGHMINSIPVMVTLLLSCPLMPLVVLFL